MALLSRMYFNAVFGGLGGLFGWLLLGVFCDKNTAEQLWQNLLKGALIGGSIGYFVVSVEALRDRSLLRFRAFGHLWLAPRLRWAEQWGF